MKPLPRVKITIEVGGKVHRLSLVPQPRKGRYWLRYNGKGSEKMPECTISKLMDECRRIIVKGEAKEKIMTTIDDQAANTDEFFRDIALKARKPEPRTHGKCMNCGEPCQGSYCNAECREDGELRAKMKGIKS